MSATFVRLGPADLAAMAKRLNTMLTDEGAKAWYAHDVAELLQEVVALRQEIEDARQRLLQDFQHEMPEDASLPIIAQVWKNEVTGLYEKAQYKQLRAKANEFQASVIDLETKLEREQEDRAHLIFEHAAAQCDWEQKEAGLQHAIRDHVETLAAVEQKKQELAEALQQVTERLETKDHEFARLAMAASQELEQVKERARAVLMQAIESLS